MSIMRIVQPRDSIRASNYREWPVVSFGVMNERREKTMQDESPLANRTQPAVGPTCRAMKRRREDEVKIKEGQSPVLTFDGVGQQAL